jgi:hypothetical protein
MSNSAQLAASEEWLQTWRAQQQGMPSTMHPSNNLICGLSGFAGLDAPTLQVVNNSLMLFQTKNICDQVI